jgi:adenylate cyclase
MAEPWLIQVLDNQKLVFSRECTGPMELGRQKTVKQRPEELYELTMLETGGCRLVIAVNEEISVSRQHALISPVTERRIELTNLSGKVSFTAGAIPDNGDDGGLITDPSGKISFMAGEDRAGETFAVKPGQNCQMDLPAFLEIGSKVICLQPLRREKPADMLQSLAAPTLRPSSSIRSRLIPIPGLKISETTETEGDHVIHWVKATMEVLQSAATDSDFYQKAAQAVVDVGRMDNGRVLLRKNGEWHTVACAALCGEDDMVEPPSRLVLKKVCEEKRTFWLDPLQVAAKEGAMAPSLAGVHAALAAPILDRQGEVIAALYGERRISATSVSSNCIFSKMDAILIDLLAGGVAAGLARVEQERKALGLLTQFEQFFTPDLARQLVEQPELLQGKDLEISALFVDIQAFSRLSRDLGPALALEWVGDVMSTLSDCVLNHQGVVVDYVGDALMAMWGAPQPQPDHAARACRAALEMLESLPGLDARWQETLRQPMNLTIGINTGLARVGNTGSARKFKYGPLGDTVNVASRVQGAAKYFKTSLLLTKHTRACLGTEFHARRLGLVRAQNMADPLDLYELFTKDYPLWSELATDYEAALAEFEAGQFRQSARRLGQVINRHTDDGPTFALLARATSCMLEQPVPFDPAFRLPGK